MPVPGGLGGWLRWATRATRAGMAEGGGGGAGMGHRMVWVDLEVSGGCLVGVPGREGLG